MNLPLKKRPLRYSESSSEEFSLTEESPTFSNLKRKFDVDKSNLRFASDVLPLTFPSFSPLKRFKFNEQTLNLFYNYSVSDFESRSSSKENYQEDGEEEINVVDVEEEGNENGPLLSPFLSTSSFSSRSSTLPSPVSLTSRARYVLSNHSTNFHSEHHTCKECGKKFESTIRFKAHLRRHSSKTSGRYSCNLCDKKFVQRSSLTTHFRIHSGERPYKCTECPESFGDFSTFTKHKRTHTGEKPYGCPVCGRKFSQSGNMHRHWKSVHSTHSHRA